MTKINNKGWIALDIDGTVTPHLHMIPDEVSNYLKTLAADGWRFMFITGRAYSFAHTVLKPLDFPFHLALQNGADILEMPTQRVVSRSYLGPEVIAKLEEAYSEAEEDFIVYAGYEKGDFCYYRPDRLSPELKDYMERLKKLVPEPWVEFHTFDEIEQKAFPLIKCIGTEPMMREIYAKLEKDPTLHATLIRDPVLPGLYLILITSPEATKGRAIDQIVKGEDLVIAAGDDLNDLSMIERADIRIVMETAPQELLQKAHIIAPSAAKFGIIQALEKATKADIASWKEKPSSISH